MSVVLQLLETLNVLLLISSVSLIGAAIEILY